MATLTAGLSNLFLGPLGNVRVEFNGYFLGKTTEDTSLTKTEDVKDILYSQDGTQPSDHVSTGMLLHLNATFGEINTQLMEQVLYSFTTQNTDPATDDSGTFGRYIYTSLRDNKAKKLKVYATDSDGAALTTNAYDVLNFYEALAVINENLINWGADTQRNLPVDFMIYYSEFGASQVSGGPAGAFGYYGDAATELVPDIATYPS